MDNHRVCVWRWCWGWKCGFGTRAFLWTVTWKERKPEKRIELWDMPIYRGRQKRSRKKKRFCELLVAPDKTGRSRW